MSKARPAAAFLGLSLLLSCGAAENGSNAAVNAVGAPEPIACDDCAPASRTSRTASVPPAYAACGLSARDSDPEPDVGYVPRLPDDARAAKSAADCIEKARAPGIVPMLLVYSDDLTFRKRHQEALDFRLRALKNLDREIAEAAARQGQPRLGIGSSARSEAARLAKRILSDRSKYSLRLDSDDSRYLQKLSNFSD
jgi:hypothetical protein